MSFESIEGVQDCLAQAQYVASRALATTVFLAIRMGRPLFLEGEAGVGKTEVAKVLALGLGRELIRLQCYDGLDAASAAYEWNFPKQMLEIRAAQAASDINPAAGSTHALDLYDNRFLLKRPLLRALEPHAGGPPVLLIDELDRADEPFEAYLLEVLSDFQISIPELGVIKATQPPIVVITSNRTREIHDAIKRRCLYFWVDYPDAARELEIVRRKAPEASEDLSRQVVAFVQKLRRGDLFKAPGIAETLDWTRALTTLDALSLDPQVVDDTLGALLKYQDDLARVQGATAAALIAEIRAEAGT
ncbi:AAA+ ATPase domain-containing protein [Pararobbsia alpina]|uniref:AAA family ATPase n=1 Tax=Pararobbsia alpina TaxID=621374 RepID=UPI0039A779A6